MRSFQYFKNVHFITHFFFFESILCAHTPCRYLLCVCTSDECALNDAIHITIYESIIMYGRMEFMWTIENTKMLSTDGISFVCEFRIKNKMHSRLRSSSSFHFFFLQKLYASADERKSICLSLKFFSSFLDE